MATNKATITENAQVLSTSAFSGYGDLSAPSFEVWQQVDKLAAGFITTAKTNALNVNPAVLFIKLAKVLKQACSLARLPESFADSLRSRCNGYGMDSLEAVLNDGFMLTHIGKTTNTVSVAKLEIAEVRKATLKRKNLSKQSELFILRAAIRKLESTILTRELAYKDTESQSTKLGNLQRFETLLLAEIAESKASQAKPAK